MRAPGHLLPGLNDCTWQSFFAGQLNPQHHTRLTSHLSMEEWVFCRKSYVGKLKEKQQDSDCVCCICSAPKNGSSLLQQCQDCGVWMDMQGSDHAPVWADWNLSAPLPTPEAAPPLSTRYMFTGAACTRPSQCTHHMCMQHTGS